MDLIKSIQERKSCRTFNTESIKPSDSKQLEEFISANNIGLNGESINFILLKKKRSDKPMKIPYGLIRNNKTYIFGKINSTALARTNYGYLLEKIVLKATELKLGTCWVGIFDRDYFSNIEIENNLEIPSILIIGNAEERMPLKERFIRKIVSADHRKPWESLFFNYETLQILTAENVQLYEETLSMTRLAPSSGNSQPWRVFYSSSNNEFHFYKKIVNNVYESKGLHDIDMGIAMSHFELVSIKNNLKGKWIIQSAENIKAIDDLQYTYTWKCE